MDKHTATEVAYHNGYAVGLEKGYEAGKVATAEQIFTDIDKLHLHVSNEYEARAYEELKKKYGVSNYEINS